MARQIVFTSRAAKPSPTYSQAMSVAVAAALGVCLLAGVPLEAQSTNVGSVNVGSASASPTAVTFTLDAAGTVGSIAVLTQGAMGLDFTDAGTGTCKAATAYNAGDTCTVNVTFKPKHPGWRYGAAELLDSAGNLLAMAYLQGTGIGPQATFANTTTGAYLASAQTILASGFIACCGTAVDASDNVFVNDVGNSAVKEIVAAGGYTTVKNLGSEIYEPQGVAVDGAGNVFVTDLGRNTTEVKEILAVGGYTTVKILSSGYSQLAGIAVDGGGNLFVADIGDQSFNKSAVYEILAAGGYTTVKTLGSGFKGAWGLAVDGNGNVFVGDFFHSAVKEIMAAGGYTTVKTLGGDFRGPAGVAVDGSGNVFVLYESNNLGYGPDAVKEIPASCIAGANNSTCVLSLGTGYNQAGGLAVDGSGNIFLDEQGVNPVVKLDYADPPSLTFAKPEGGTTSPQVVTVSNNGNADLTFPVPATGNNPSFTGAGFTMDAATTCPQLDSGSTAATLTAGASCNYAVDFLPVAVGTYTGALTLTDNSLNASPDVSQTIPLTGTLFGPPSAESVSPSSGFGITQQFSFVASSPNGAGSLSAVYMLFNTKLSQSNACYLAYYVAQNQLSLASDSANYSTSGRPGAAGTLSNSQCSVDLSATTVTASGDTLTVAPAITFKSGFTAGIKIYMQVLNIPGMFTGWKKMGSWMVGSVADGPPSAVSVSPSSGFGTTQQFSFVNTKLSQLNGCYLAYYLPQNQLSLAADISNPSTSTLGRPGATGTLSNSQCSVDLSATTVTASGNTLTVAPAITFKSGFTAGVNISTCRS
jgi:large repetitive protein